MEKYFKYIVIAVFGVVFLSLPAGIPTIKSSSEYSSFNADWNGCSKFTKAIYNSNFEITPVISPFDDYNFDKNGVLLIIGPRVEFSDYEIFKIKTFIENGNTLVIADDFGTSNQIFEKLNISTRFSRYSINDVFYSENQNLIEYAVPKSYGGGKITTNIPTSITNPKNLVFVNSSNFSSPIGNLPAISEINYGNGNIILISDPDIFSNGLYETNQKFLEGFIQKLNHKHVYIDEIHHKDFGYEIDVFYIQKSVPKDLVLSLLLMIIVFIKISDKKLFNVAIKKLISKFIKKSTNLDEETLNYISKNNGIDFDDLKRVMTNIKDGKNGRKRIFK